MASGRPDWYSSVAMHGRFAEAGEDDKYITVAVDDLGKMLALMTGKLGDVYTPVAVDGEGIMKANLALQDLTRLTMRTSLGTPVKANLSHTFVGTGNFDVVDIEGKGVILGGTIIHNVAASHKTCRVTLTIDDVDFGAVTIRDLRTINAVREFEYPFRLIHYDDQADYYYAVAFSPGWTFDTKLKVTLSEIVGASQWDGYLYYTLAT